MNPVYEFIGTTNSTKLSKKQGGKEVLTNRVFIIKKTLSDGTVRYGEYTVAKVNSMTIALRCLNRKCNAVITIESTHEIIIQKTHIERNGKKRNVYNFSPEADLTDDSKYDRPHHNHTNTAKCRSFNRFNECKNTIHIENCQYEKKICSINARNFSERAIRIGKNDPSLSVSKITEAIDINNLETGPKVPAGNKVVLDGTKETRVYKRIWAARGLDRKSHLDDPGEIPLDVQRLSMRKLDGTVVTENFTFKTDQHLICVIPSELNRLINTNWYFDATFKACNAMIGYYQTLIITTKHEVGDRVFLYPISLILMKNKTTNAYISALKDLQRIHALYNPDQLPLFPNQISHDFEGGIISAINSLFPNTRKRFCLFHHKQSVNRIIDGIFPGHLKFTSEAKYLRKILGFFPTLPLYNAEVRFSLISHLEFVGSELDDEQRAKLNDYIAYIQRTYLSETHYFSHLNSEHFNGILEEEHDCTSSSAESINAKLNSTFSNGKKSLASVLYQIHKFKKDFYELKLERLSENNLRPRTPAFLQRKQKLVDNFTEFNLLTPEIQALNLIPFMIENMYL